MADGAGHDNTREPDLQGEEVGADLGEVGVVKGQHYLVILCHDDIGIDWEVEHPADCPTEPSPWDGVGVDYACNVGIEIHHAGLDGLPGWEKLPVGRYAIEFWSEYHPATPYNGGAEVDAGLAFNHGDCGAVASPKGFPNA